MSPPAAGGRAHRPGRPCAGLTLFPAALALAAPGAIGGRRVARRASLDPLRRGRLERRIARAASVHPFFSQAARRWPAQRHEGCCRRERSGSGPHAGSTLRDVSRRRQWRGGRRRRHSAPVRSGGLPNGAGLPISADSGADGDEPFVACAVGRLDTPGPLTPSEDLTSGTPSRPCHQRDRRPPWRQPQPHGCAPAAARPGHARACVVVYARLAGEQSMRIACAPHVHRG